MKSNRGRGRPAKDIVWPNSQFTISTLAGNSNISTACARIKINKGLANGKIRQVGAENKKTQRVFELAV